MSTHCIACKKEITKKQATCYICGSSQSYLSYYSKSIASLTIVIIIAGWISNEIIDNRILDSQNAQILKNEASLVHFNKTKSELNQKILTLAKAKETANLEIEELKASIALGSSSSTEILKDLEKEQSRSKWLSQENRKFTAKIKDLTERIALLEQQELLAENKEQLVPLEKVIQTPLANKVTSDEIIENTETSAEASDNDI